MRAPAGQKTPTRESSIDRMIEDFYFLLGRTVRKSPTASLPTQELYLLVQLLFEELGEFEKAVEARDIYRIADAVGDIAYVAYGAAKQFGIDLPCAVWSVHQESMGPLRTTASPADGETACPDQTAPSIEEMVDEWYQAAGWPPRQKPTADISPEEETLLTRAMANEARAFVAATALRKIDQITPAIAAVTYLAYRAAKHYGFDLRRVIEAVHQSNMSKRNEDGLLDKDESGKVRRGRHYRKPRIAEALGDPTRVRRKRRGG